MALLFLSLNLSYAKPPSSQSFPITFNQSEVDILWTITEGDRSSQSPIAADIDGDMKPELVLITEYYSNNLTIRNGEDGTLAWTCVVPGVFATRPIILDVNDDGISDIVVASHFSIGGYIIAFDGRSGQEIWRNNIHDTDPASLSSGDVDGDLEEEIVAFGNTNYVTVIHRENGSIVWEDEYDGQYWRAEWIALADTNNNGRCEIIFWQYSTYSMMIVDGVTGIPTSVIPHIGPIYHNPVIADLNQDGVQDIICSSHYSGIGAYEIPTGNLLWTRNVTSFLRYTRGIAVADLTGDSKFEIVISGNNQITVLRGIDGTTLWRKSIAGNLPVSIGDADGDGDLDIISVSSEGEVYFIEGDTGEILRTFSTRQSSFWSPLLYDLDQDGFIEVVVLTRYGIFVLDLEEGAKRIFWQATGGAHDFSGANSVQFVDQDNDMLSDYSESLFGSDMNSNDSDLDSMPDGYETHHGLNPLLNDTFEDLDGDTLTNIGEFHLGTSPKLQDSDRDLLTDPDEINIYGTNPAYYDSDMDHLGDGWEVMYGLNPLAWDDYQADPDQDSLRNFYEYKQNTNPFSSDSDSDLMSDDFEISYGLNPLLDDSMEDPDCDILSNLQEFYLGTSPASNDSDSDQLPDFWEYSMGTNPTQRDEGEDPDNDTLTNLEEYYLGTDPLVDDSKLDSDGDTLSNLDEYRLGTNVSDIDSDNDLMSDSWEIEWGYDPLDGNVSAIQYFHYYSPVFLTVGILSIGIIVLISQSDQVKEKLLKTSRVSCLLLPNLFKNL